MSKYIIKINARSFCSKDLEKSWKVRMEFFDCVRQRIFNGRRKASCCHCSRLITIDKATIEHIVPRSHGGELFIPTNLTIACASCNRKRGTQDFDTFRLKRKEQVQKYDRTAVFVDRIETTNDYELLAA